MRSFDHRWQFLLGLFGSAMMTMVQRLDAGSFFLDPLLSVFIFLALVLKVCRNRFSCHGQSVAELAPSRLSNLALYHRSVTNTNPGAVKGHEGHHVTLTAHVYATRTKST